MERKTHSVPTPAPQSPTADGDPDELNNDLDSDEQTQWLVDRANIHDIVIALVCAVSVVVLMGARMG